MGRSPRFCFSIKACAGKADDGDFSRLLEVKPSPEKRRWSFRKKHAGHHEPSNTVISEPLPIVSENQNREVTADAFYSEKASSDIYKASVVGQISPTLQFPSDVVSTRVPKELSSTSTVLVDHNITEHVIVIQTSIRRCLAQNELQKLRNVVKLQAATRGYLVRRQAAGTLRCIQAIVKIQTLVRARHSVQSTGLTEKNNLDECMQADVVKQSNLELNKTPSAMRKLVSSAFARQLLQSTPKAKSIRISGDPLRPDSAWNWLERWMALTSMDQQTLVLNQEDLDKEMKNDLANDDVGLHVIPQHASSDLELSDNSPEVPEVEGDLITKSSRSTELSAPACVSDQFLICPVPDDELQSRVQETVVIENDKDCSEREVKEVFNYISSQMQQPLDNLHEELDGNLGEPDYTQDNFKNGARNKLFGADEIEEGKALNGSRKSKNPAFAAVQAKFEELSSAPDSNRYFDYSSSIVVTVSKSAHSQVDFTSNNVNERKSVYSKVDKEVILNEKLSSHSTNGQGAASGYGTEISVASLDKPEDSVAEIVPELRTSDEISHGVVSVAIGSLKFDEIEAETKNYLSNLVAVQPQRNAESSKNAAISVSSVEEAVQVEEDAEYIYIDKVSLYGSPRSHSAVGDSPTAPSSQISLRVRTAKAEDNIPARKKSQLAVRNSPTHLKNDSDARSSGEQFRKGIKNVRRPNSSGSDKTNHVDHEDRNSSNSLPNYMQLTESAKAKINTNFIQKSSIGLHHKDNLIKKRHSMPIGNEKQGLSPRMQSPKSQTPKALKINGVSTDNSTERRWQI